MECTIDAGFEAITGTELLAAVPGGSLALKAGQVYVLAVVVPESLDDPIWSSANVLLEPTGETPQERIAEALELCGNLAGDIVLNSKR